MKKSVLPVLFLLFFAITRTWGQQDPMFTNYFFNSLIFNPAVAGVNEHLTGALIYRSQWLGLEGAPTTQSLSVHSPLKNERIGLGLSLVNDQIGAGGTFDATTSYAYHFPLNKNLKLSVGLQAGITNWRGDWHKLEVEDNTDAVFTENLSRWLPNFGAGVFLHSKRFFAGAGCPRILEHDLRDNNGQTSFYAKTYRHYYTVIGAAFPLSNEQIVFRPSALVKSTGFLSKQRKYATPQDIGSPTELDLDVSFFFYETFWIGTAYRTALELGDSSNDSADIWASFYFRNGLRLGASYDLTLSQLNKVGNGSFEVMAGYEFDVKVRRVASPRYF